MSNYLDKFEDPSAMFRGAPFWAWNCKLNEKQLMGQLEYFRKMGFGGATIHCRTGLDTEYMGSEFMGIVRSCIKKAEEMNMKIYLYDEDRWPSGFGGGEVTKNVNYRARYLVFTKDSPETLTVSENTAKGSTASASIQGNGKLIAKYQVDLKDGYLTSYHRLSKNDDSDNVWYAYLEVKDDDPWYNNQAYVDTLNKEAIECFIKTTHEKYAEEFGDKFGTLIPSVFTDEPQFTHKMVFECADDTKGVIIPYTDDFEKTYKETYRESFLDHLPEVFWELTNKRVSETRYRYHDHITERFAQAYSDTVGSWCDKHHIALTGHMMDEPTLFSQTHALGEAMRHYRGFKIPGIDMLCDRREYTTAKQAQSAAHQMGSNEVTSELYGVTNWDFDFRGHKLQGDWQAALGVTHRVPHLAWVSMAGEAKRDYPASISYQSPWSGKYSVIENYFARVNTALMSGKPHVRIGVIHPIESYWLFFGPDEQTKAVRDKMENKFANLTQWLLFGLMDFDFISESLWDTLGGGEEDSKLKVGNMAYDVIIVPELVTYRSSTIKRLKGFLDKGGKVIFMGDPGKYVDAKESDAPKELARRGVHINFDRDELLEAISRYRELDMHDLRGMRSGNYIYQMRDDGDNKIVFIANARRDANPDTPAPETYRITFTGAYEADILDAMTGKRKRIGTECVNGNTEIIFTLYEEDSLLLYLTKANGKSSVPSNVNMHHEANFELVKELNNVDAYRLSEPNVLMLDQAEYSLDGEEFSPSDEVLRIDNILRKRLAYPLKMESYAQPWTRMGQKSEDQHRLRLRYTFYSEIDNVPVELAIETPPEMLLIWNLQPVHPRKRAYYVDESIHTYELPCLRKGKNELIVDMNYNRWSNLEWCYLTGNFGVYIYGNKAKVVPVSDRIGFSDLTSQGLSFYGGNVSYLCEVSLPDGKYVLEAAKFRSPLLSVKVDGKVAGDIMFSPYRVSLGYLNSGKHDIEIISYGNRINTFGTVHNCDDNTSWVGPETWRSTGTSYSYEYQLKRTGILAAPKLYRAFDS